MSAGTPGTKLRIKNAAATLAKQGAAVLTETFDFPFRKGIPIGLVTIKATLSRLTSSQTAPRATSRARRCC